MEENLAENAAKQGKTLMDGLRTIQKSSNLVTTVRGKGLLIALEIDNSRPGEEELAWDICMTMSEKGLLAKPTHGNIIRFAPPLVIDDSQVG